MQGYTWSSNQRPSQRYQDRPPPQYQERLPPHYQERSPPQYQERLPPQYQERSPPQYQERLPPQYQERSPPNYQERSPPQYQEHFPSNYHAVRNDQPSAFQVQLIPQMQTTLQTRYSNGQQEAANQWNACSGSDFSTFQPNSNGYDWLKRTNQIHPQHRFTANHTQQHYPPDNPNAYRHHPQFVQWHDSSPQNYRNTGYSQAPMYWSPQSDHGSSVGNSRGWSSHISNNGSSCSMNNQQQFQAPRIAAHHHHQHQQQEELSRQYSGKTRRCHTQYSSQASQKIPNNQAQSRIEANRTSCNSTTPPSEAQSNVSLPSNNLNQSPVDQNRPELGSNAGPYVSATQPQNNQDAGHQSQGTNNGTCNVNQTSQTTQTSKAQLQPHSKTDFNLSSYADSIIYRLLCSNDNEQSDERTAHQNTRPEQSEVCATRRTDNHSEEPRAQCTVEPPSKRMKYAVIQRGCWNKVTIVSKDKIDFGVQYAQTGTHQTSNDENRRKGTSQHNIQYSTDPADCLEVVFALQKAAQQIHKAIAIVPPISQQIINAAPTADTSPKKAESPPLKIDCVWSLVEESNEQKTVNDKLSESSSQTAEQDNKSLENTTESNIADPDACSASRVECQNDVQQSDCDSSDPSFDLSNVPVIDHTLEKLMDLAKSLEMTELLAGYPEYSESVLERIVKLYWNGKASNMLEPLKSFGEVLHLSIIYAKDYGSVVFKGIETENLKKLAHCDILKKEMYSSSEEFRSSWLNVDGQPADIEKVLSEPQLDDATVFKATPQTFSDNTVVASASLGVNSLTDMPEVSSEEKSVNPHTSSPTDLFIQKAGNDSEEVTAENHGHSYVVLRKESEKETFKKQEDINQNQNFNTEPSDISPLAERSTEKPADLGNAKEVFRQDHEQTRDNVSDSPSLSPGDSVSDGVKNSEVSFSTETHCTSMDTLQVEDVSDDKNPGNKEALNNSSDTWLVEDISNDENPVSKEALNNSSETWLVEEISDDENPGDKEALKNTSDTWPVDDISDDENSGNEVLLNSPNIWQVGDISDNENPGNMDTPSNSSDIFAVEDVSADENSSDDSLFMGITVLSSEDAKTFFQQFEKEPECNIKTKSQSNFEHLDLVACFDAHSQPNHKHNKAYTCFRCGAENAKSSSTNVTKTDSDADLFCPECWEQAPLFELEEEPYEANLPGSAAKPKKLGQNYSLPCLKLEVNEPNLASTKECIVYEGLKGQKSDCLVKSKSEENCSPPSLKTEVKESTVASNDECIAYEGLAGQKSAFLVQSEQGHNCSPPSVELKDKKPNVALPETCIAEEGLAGQKRDFIVKSELVENRSPPSLKTEVKESTVASNDECIAYEGLEGQKSAFLVKSEQGHNCSPPSVELKDKKPNVALPETCIAEEGLTGQKRDFIVKSELVENRSPPSLKTEVKESTVASNDECIAYEGLAGQKSAFLVQSEQGQNCSLPSVELKDKKPNVALPETCIAEEGLAGQKRDFIVKSELVENRSPPSLKTEVKESTVASNDECIAYEGLEGQKSAFLVKSEQGHNCSPPSVELKDKKPNVALPETCIAEEGLTGQKRDFIVKSELVENRSPPSLKTEVKESTVASNDECIAYEGLAGQKSAFLVQSEQGQNCSPPSVELKDKKPNVALPETCIAEEGLAGQKRDFIVKSELVENCSPPSLKTEVKESTVASNDECIAYEGLAGQKSAFLVQSEQGQNCSPPSVELKDKKSNVALPETCIAEEGLAGQKRDCMVKSELVENRSQPSLKLEIKEPTVASTKQCIAGQGQKSDSMIQSELRQNCCPPSIKLQVEMPKVSSPEECIADEGLRSPQRNSMAKSEMGQNRSSPSLELKVKESDFVLPKTCIADEGQIVKKSGCMGESELGQNRSPQCLKLEVKEPIVASAEDCIADKGLTGPKSDSMVKSVTKTVSEIQGSAEREITKIQPNKQKNEKTKKIRVPKSQSLKQCRKPFPKKTVFSKHKLKSGNISTGSDDSVLFAPDIVVKMNWPQKKKLPGVSANKRRSGESQNCSKVKKFKEHRQERQDNPDRTSTIHRENLQKVTEKVSDQSNDTPSQESENKPELHGILSVNKIKRTEPKKVRFDLYGSKTEKQYYAPERRFSAPATLTVSDCKDNTDMLSAKQKVLNQWSSTFIPKTKKTCHPRSPQEKKPQKPQDLLKSNMSALKSHLTHRAKLLSSSDRESHFRKKNFIKSLGKH